MDATNIYWTNNGGAAVGNVMKCTKTVGNCNPTALAAGSSQPWQSSPFGIAVDATSVYWTTNTSSGSVWACAIGGCGNNPTQLASGQDQPQAVAVDGTSVYWVAHGGGAVMKVAK